MRRVCLSARLAAVSLLCLISACSGDGGGDPPNKNEDGGVTPNGPPGMGTRVAYRVESLALLDPHVNVNAGLLGCVNATDDSVAGARSVNAELLAALTADEYDDNGNLTPDGKLDANLVMSMDYDPTKPTFEATLNTAIDCTAPVATTACRVIAGANAQIRVQGTHRTSGACVEVPSDTLTAAYGPAPQAPTAPCGALSGFDLPLQFLTGVPATLRNARIIFRYENDGAELTGLIVSELAEDEATETVNFGLGPQTVASLFPGGTGACTGAGADDRDTLTSGKNGWFFYMGRMRARRVTLTE